MKRAKVGHRLSGYRDTGFNLDSHIVAIAEKKVLHILDCVGRVSRVSRSGRKETRRQTGPMVVGRGYSIVAERWQLDQIIDQSIPSHTLEPFHST